METVQNALKQIPLRILTLHFTSAPRCTSSASRSVAEFRLGSSGSATLAVGIGGAYGTWGESYDNEDTAPFVEQVMGEPLANDEKLNLSELGFLHRQHIPTLSEADNLELEVEVGQALPARGCQRQRLGAG